MNKIGARFVSAQSWNNRLLSYIFFSRSEQPYNQVDLYRSRNLIMRIIKCIELFIDYVPYFLGIYKDDFSFRANIVRTGICDFAHDCMGCSRELYYNLLLSFGVKAAVSKRSS